MRNERVDTEEIPSTKSEKVLAVVLGVFVFVGAIWAYIKIDLRYAPGAGPTGTSTLVEIALILGLLSLGFGLMTMLRALRSRYLPLSFGVVIPACVLAVVFAAEFSFDRFGFRRSGPLVLSLVGVAATLVAFYLLQRHLATRIPNRRVRKGDCPFCGYPLRSGAHCEGCGRDVIGECTSCGGERRIGSAHCACCGKA